MMSRRARQDTVSATPNVPSDGAPGDETLVEQEGAEGVLRDLSAVEEAAALGDPEEWPPELVEELHEFVRNEGDLADGTFREGLREALWELLRHRPDALDRRKAPRSRR